MTDEGICRYRSPGEALGASRQGGDDHLMQPMSWEEDAYGILKRWLVFREWVETSANQRGLARLSVLDYGCGTGALVTYPLARLGHTVLGSDVHVPSIELARTRYRCPNLTFEAVSVERLVERKALFDVVICSEVLEHLANPEEFLRSLRKLVVPQGIVIITTPNGYGAYELCCSLERVLKRLRIDQSLRRLYHLVAAPSDRLHGGNDKDEGERPSESGGFLNVDSVHIQFFRRRTLERLFHLTGFVVVERRARTLLCGPYLDAVLKRLPFRRRLYRCNGRLADALPFTWAADWMYLLKPTDTTIA